MKITRKIKGLNVRKVFTQKTVTIFILTVFGIVLLYIFFFTNVFIIHSINVNILNPEVITKNNVLVCSKYLLKRRFIEINSEKEAKNIKTCLQNAQWVKVDKNFPFNINIKVAEYNVILRSPLSKDNVCNVITSDEHVVSLSKELCDKYNDLPELITKKQSLTPTTLNFVVNLHKLISKTQPKLTPRKYIVTTYKNTTILKVSFPQFVLILDPQKDPNTEFNKFYQIYLGLYNNKENFKSINLLFDRAIVK